jgi:hypothetical protein
MFSRISALAASILAVLAISSAGASAHPRHHPTRVGSKHHPAKSRPEKLPADFAAWSKVAVCESGGWVVLGSAYPDSLGITATNFHAFGGQSQPVGATSLAERVAQIRVADRLIHHYGISIPDQAGCAGSW